jgi:hypothetical protein
MQALSLDPSRSHALVGHEATRPAFHLLRLSPYNATVPSNKLGNVPLGSQDGEVAHSLPSAPADVRGRPVCSCGGYAAPSRPSRQAFGSGATRMFRIECHSTSSSPEKPLGGPRAPFLDTVRMSSLGVPFLRPGGNQGRGSRLPTCLVHDTTLASRAWLPGSVTGIGGLGERLVIRIRGSLEIET